MGSTRINRSRYDLFDGVLNEQCFEYGECADLQPYLDRRKTVLNVEYTTEPDCAAARQSSILTIRRDLLLRGAKEPGYLRQSCQAQPSF